MSFVVSVLIRKTSADSYISRFFHLFVLFFSPLELVIPSKPRLFVSHPLAKFRSPCELNSAILQNSTESGAQ